MKYKSLVLALACLSSQLYADNDRQLHQDIQRLQVQARELQTQLDRLQKQLVAEKQQSKGPEAKNKAAGRRTEQAPQNKQTAQAKAKKSTNAQAYAARPISYKTPIKKPRREAFHSANVSVHTPAEHPEQVGFFPTALVAEGRVVTYIAGTPVVSSPYLGDRPAFDGSDYIVNISSINRDVRLLEQRNRLYNAYKSIGYPIPPMPIIAVSGKAEPVAVINNPYNGNALGDFNLGSSEIDFAAALNENVEAYIALAYDADPPAVGPRVDNSAFNLNMGFVNIGNLDKTPFYFTAGQLYVPFGRYSTSMISAPLTLDVARTKTRPFILGYKSQQGTGLFAAAYGYSSDTTLGRSGVGGVNLGYIFNLMGDKQEIGVSYISSVADSGGMQATGSAVGTTFGGFGSLLNGNEFVRKTPAMGVHANLNKGPFLLTAEWVGATEPFRVEDLMFNGQGAQPQAVQMEGGMTFTSFNRPSSVAVSYQWSKEALALNLPEQRISAVYNISIWKDTVESIEYRHDIDYGVTQYANGAAPIGGSNLNTIGTGSTADTLLLQIGVYF
ncbi:MAG: LbtU family siderophore porin [Legionella sp.]|jgi:hypothetical protein